MHISRELRGLQRVWKIRQEPQRRNHPDTNAITVSSIAFSRAGQTFQEIEEHDIVSVVVAITVMGCYTHQLEVDATASIASEVKPGAKEDRSRTVDEHSGARVSIGKRESTLSRVLSCCIFAVRFEGD